MREQAAGILQVLGLLSVLLLLFHLATGRSWTIIFAFKLTHLLPAILQSTIYLYWWMYWSGVGEYVPLLAMQLAFAYLFEAFFSLAVHRTWKVGFGPLPVVGSTGLFIWFVGGDVWLGFLAIAIAIGSKNLLRPGDAHVFNPSALGISVIGIMALLWPQQVGYTDIASELNLAPNMTELILLLALVVMFKLKTVTLTLSAFATLWALHWFNFVDVLLPTWPAVFLVMTLLATDPFTSPRTPLGRIIFGVLLGLGLGICGEVLVGFGQSDFFAKVFPVVLINPLAGPLDRLAKRAPQWIGQLAQTRVNVPLVASWVAIVVVALSSGAKEGAFETSLHAEYQTPHIRASQTTPPSCSANRVFCEPFSVVDEVSLWVSPSTGTRPPRSR